MWNMQLEKGVFRYKLYIVKHPISCIEYAFFYSAIMLATQAMPVHLDHTASALQHEVGNLMHSGSYYVTPEICRELKHIQTGADYIKLDQNFVSSSRDFSNKFDPNMIATEIMGK